LRFEKINRHCERVYWDQSFLRNASFFDKARDRTLIAGGHAGSLVTWFRPGNRRFRPKEMLYVRIIFPLKFSEKLLNLMFGFAFAITVFKFIRVQSNGREGYE